VVEISLTELRAKSVHRISNSHSLIPNVCAEGDSCYVELYERM
jgi:hypothetical protein